jgi:hypothetical protein
MLKMLLQMNKRASRLDQPFKEVGIRRVGVKPKLFQDIMRFVVLLFVPATKKRAVIRMTFHIGLIRVHLFPGCVSQPL